MAMQAVGLSTWTFRNDLAPLWWVFPFTIIKWLSFFLCDSLCSEVSLIWYHSSHPSFVLISVNKASFSSRFRLSASLKLILYLPHSPGQLLSCLVEKLTSASGTLSPLGFYSACHWEPQDCCGSLLMTIWVAGSPSYLRWVTSVSYCLECKQAEVASLLERAAAAFWV